jgi:hypothetical protein
MTVEVIQQLLESWPIDDYCMVTLQPYNIGNPPYLMPICGHYISYEALSKMPSFTIQDPDNLEKYTYMKCPKCRRFFPFAICDERALNLIALKDYLRKKQNKEEISKFEVEHQVEIPIIFSPVDGLLSNVEVMQRLLS